MRIEIIKHLRQLTVLDDSGSAVFCCRTALGFCPEGNKERAGDGRTPEGEYYICLRRENGKFGPSLGLSYPSSADALRLRAEEDLLEYIRQCEREQKRPPWGTALGGEICIHGGGSGRDWTAGCIALEAEDIAQVYALCREGDPVRILP